MKKPQIIAIVFAWLVLFGFAGLVIKKWVIPSKKDRLISATSADKKYKTEVTIGCDSFPGYAILRSSIVQSDLNRSGIRLIFADDGADYSKRIDNLKSGNTQMAVFTIDSLITSSVNINDYPATIVLLIDRTIGADALVAYKDVVPNIQALDTPEARLFFTSNSPAEFISRIAVAFFNLPRLSSQWGEARNSPDEVLSELRRNKTGKCAYALWEPYVSLALQIDNVHVVFDTTKVNDFVVDVLTAERKFLQDNKSTVEEVTKSYLRAVYYYANNRPALAALIEEDSKKFGKALTLQQSEISCQRIQWKNTSDNYAHFGIAGQSTGISHVQDIIANISEVLLATGGLKRDGNTIHENPLAGKENILYHDRIISDLQSSNFHPATKLNIAGANHGFVKEQAHSGAQLRKLTDAEWDQLVTVGNIRINPIEFGRGTVTLNVAAERELRLIADRLSSLPEYYLVVVGRANARGDFNANSALAKQRADLVASFLQSCGVDEIRMRSVARRPAMDDTGSVTFVVGQTAY